MPPPSVTGEVYCFPRCQLIFRFGWRCIYHSKGLREYIPKSIPSVCLSVCTMVFKRIAGLRFYPKSLCYASMDSIQWDLQTTEKVFFKFQIHFRNFGRKPENIEKNSAAWILIKLQCVIYQWFRLNKLYKLMESFFKFQFSFRIIGRKPKNIQTAWILIEVQCIMYQWIWLDMLYKLMESFFSNFGIIFQIC